MPQHLNDAAERCVHCRLHADDQPFVCPGRTIRVARTVTVDGFPYTTTAPDRSTLSHYERLLAEAECENV